MPESQAWVIIHGEVSKNAYSINIRHWLLRHSRTYKQAIPQIQQRPANRALIYKNVGLKILLHL